MIAIRAMFAGTKINQCRQRLVKKKTESGTGQVKQGGK
ncbi:hypothetical protein ECSTECEH250_3627 [Escherichia coli STEC_EH250]|nr:hypothetical protein ECSTECEH250_3627 [Escherichia coli STEC_EH250]